MAPENIAAKSQLWNWELALDQANILAGLKKPPSRHWEMSALLPFYRNIFQGLDHVPQLFKSLSHTIK